jgi:diguanylate cyclase (GGDEF)-like protein
MTASPFSFPDDERAPLQHDLRRQISIALLEQLDSITADTVAIFPYSGSEPLDSGYCDRIGSLLVRLVSMAVRDPTLDPRGGLVADLHRVVLERALTMERLFTFAYLIERTILDELALSEEIGATSEQWPLVAQLVRRASFDFLAAYAERAVLDPSETAVTDRLTTLHTRILLDAVLAKEVERASRDGYALSLILFDVDHLAEINKEHGYGVGDRILERLGILVRKYFRQHDWVARHSEDSIAVLLIRTDAEHASELAERVRATVEERLEFTDHRTDRQVRVTVSAGAVNVNVAAGDVIDPDRLLADAEAAVERAKQNGRNRVERVDGYSGYASRSS